MNTQQAKQIRIDEYLAHLGYFPAKQGRQGLFYKSMFAPGGERTPSFQVSADGHAFHDWSTGASGNIIDLAMLIAGTHDISSALAHIESVVGQSGANLATSSSFSFYQQKKSLDILDCSELKAGALLAYARKRGINATIARTYCVQVNYSLTTRPERQYFSIGFRNDSGGYELRNQFAKVAAAPKDITTINDLCDCTMLVVEGFFDFLSAASLRWFRATEMNAVVLNSTALVERAIPVLMSARRVICLLDNDDAGRKATSKIIAACPDAEDHAYLYSGHNDLNCYLMNKSTMNK